MFKNVNRALELTIENEELVRNKQNENKRSSLLCKKKKRKDVSYYQN